MPTALLQSEAPSRTRAGCATENDTASLALVYIVEVSPQPQNLRDGNPDYDELSDDESFDDREIRMNDI